LAGALEQARARFLEHRLVTVLNHTARFRRTYVIEREVHLGDDMEAVPESR